MTAPKAEHVGATVDPYAILGVASFATAAEVREARKAAAFAIPAKFKSLRSDEGRRRCSLPLFRHCFSD